MSLRGMSRRMDWRDQSGPVPAIMEPASVHTALQTAAAQTGTPASGAAMAALAANPTLPTAAAAVATGKTTTAATTTQFTSSLGALVDAIPTEVVGPYTAIVAILSSATGISDPRPWLWLTYGLGGAVIGLYFLVTYRTGKKAKATKSFQPWAILMALLAFGIWGLVTPDSPLSKALDPEQFAYIAPITGIVGALLVTILSKPLTKKAS